MALSEPITLQIFSDSNTTKWQIDVSSRVEGAVTRSLLSYYPFADFERSTDAPITTGEVLHIKGAVEYFAPLPAVDEFTGDPLAGIVGSLSNLEPEEWVSYQVKLAPDGKNYQKEGTKKIHDKAWPIIAGAIVKTLINIAADASADANKTRRPRPLTTSVPKSLDKYEGNYQKAFEEKLAHPLLPVEVLIRYRMSSGERSRNVADSIRMALGIFDNRYGNLLVTASGKSHNLILSAGEIAALWHLPSDGIQAPGVVRASQRAKAPLPTELTALTSGILLGHNTYQGRRRPVFVVERDRITHMNIIGKTRVGKTTFMHNLIHQDIAEGRGVGVIDPHGDLVRSILTGSIPPEREKDVVLFDLSSAHQSIALNLLHVPTGVPRHAAVGLTLGVMKKIFAEQWSATRMEDALYSALAVLADRDGATIRDIHKLFFDTDYRSDVLAHSTDKAALEYWQDDYAQMSERYQMEVARPIMHRIRAFYRNPVIEAIVVKPDSLDFKAMMDEGKIFLASLAGEATQAESAILGALLISKLQMSAMSRSSLSTDQRRMFYLYIDEVQNFITTSLSVMFSEAAKYGLSLTVANQFLSQLEGGTLEAIMGNTGTTVMFSCGPQDARDLGPYVSPVFGSDDLMNLDRFQAIVKMQSSGKTLPAFSLEGAPPLMATTTGRELLARLNMAPVSSIVPLEPTSPPPAPSVPELDL